MSKSLVVFKNRRLKIFLGKNTYYVFLQDKLFFKQEMLSNRNVSLKCSKKLYYLFYVFLILERFGLVARLYA